MDRGGNTMSAKSSIANRPIKVLMLGFASLVFALSCGGGGGDKSEEACEDLIEAFAECLDVPLSNDDIDEGVDLCEDELIDEADDLGGGDCVDAVIDLIDCVVEQDCELIALLIDGDFDEMDFAECEEEIDELADSCDG